jgi:hypothetical protein
MYGNHISRMWLVVFYDSKSLSQSQHMSALVFPHAGTSGQIIRSVGAWLAVVHCMPGYQAYGVAFL